MKASSIAWFVAAIVVLGGIVWFVGNSGSRAPKAAVPAATTAATSSVSTTAPSTASIAIANFAFSPSALSIKKGTTVTWTNSDSAPHTVTGDAGGPSSGDIAKGQSYSYTFDTAGVFPYHCGVHPNMKATVTVTE